MYHWHHKHVIDHTLEPSSAVYKSWVVGKRHCTFSTHWLISIYDLFPPPNISGFIAEWVGVSHQYRDVTGLNPVDVLTFSGFYTHKCINCFHNWEDQSLPDDLFHISFHHSNSLIVDVLSQQILTVLSAFCPHSWASSTWLAGFLYDPMFYKFVQIIFNF